MWTLCFRLVPSLQEDTNMVFWKNSVWYSRITKKEKKRGYTSKHTLRWWYDVI